MMLLAKIAFLAIAYRFRGSDALTTTIKRIIWSLCVAIVANNIFVIPLAFATMLVTHGYCMNMGRLNYPQKRWPSFWLPDLTLQKWQSSKLIRVSYDFAGMASIGLIRGMILFLPSLFLGDISSYIIVCLMLSLGQALSYLIGWLIPFSIPYVRKNSTEWAEIFNGAVYALCFQFLI